MFDEIDNPADWLITCNNSVEFLEALYIHEWLSEDELNEIIKEHGVDDNSREK